MMLLSVADNGAKMAALRLLGTGQGRPQGLICLLGPHKAIMRWVLGSAATSHK
jgi:hypothetical protein